MKKFNLLVLCAAVAVSGFFSSCTKDNNTTPETTIVANLNGTDKDAIKVIAGETVIYKFTVTAPAKIKSIKVAQKKGADTTTPINKTSGFLKDTMDIVSGTVIASANITLTITVVDKTDNTVSKEVVITTDVALDPIGLVEIGDDDNATLGSSFASIDGLVYKLAEAKASSNKIDFLYFYGSTNKATIASPADATAATVFTGTSGLSSWTTKNATKLKVVTVNFETAKLSDVPDVSADGASILPNLTIDNVIAFKTASTSAYPSKKGLAKVTAIPSDGATGKIIVDIKVEL